MRGHSNTYIEYDVDSRDLRDGDLSSFERIYKKYYQSIFRFIYLSIKNQSAAEDLSQDVFVNLWKCRSTIDPSKSLKSYLFKTAHNLTVNYFRYNSRFRDFQVSELGSKNTPPDGELEMAMLCSDLAEAILHLPNSCRTVFILNRFEGLSYKEIADYLDISVNTVRNHISKALFTLRTHLHDRLDIL